MSGISNGKLKVQHRKSIVNFLVLFASFSTIVCIGLYKYFEYLNTEITQESSLHNAEIYVKALEEFRTLYTSEVINKLNQQQIEVTHDYQDKKNAVPLPATLTILLGKGISAHENGADTRLYSPFPFPWREDGGLQDKFAEQAWQYLNKNPAGNYSSFELYNGENVLRFAKADQMRESCISCHNSHLSTPKNDWKIGDVRGVLEVIIPLDKSLIASAQRFSTLLFLMILVTIIIFASASFLYIKQSNAALKLKCNARMKEVVGDLNKLLSGEQPIKELGHNFLSYLAPKLDASQATVYIFDGNDSFDHIASYAGASLVEPPLKIKLGEGLVGQAAKERKNISIVDIPPYYTQIKSSIGQATANSLLLVPIVWQDQIIAVIEFAAFQPFSDEQQKLLAELTPIIAVAFHTAKSRETKNNLLALNETYVLDLKGQRKELQASNINLKEQTQQLKASEEELKVSEEELKQQSDELKSNNEELEEQQELLEIQSKTLIESQKETLDRAEELYKSSQYKSEFLANMSHELRTPLNSLLILSQSLSENKSNNLDKQQVQEAKVIHSSGRSLLVLINDIMDLSKVEAGKLEIQIDKANVAELCDELEQLFRGVADKDNLDFNVVIENDAPKYINTDAFRLKQILKNFLANAFKFTHQGHVCLTVKSHKEKDFIDKRKNSEFIEFTVSDTGIGITESKKEDIFKAFVQADGATNRQYGGTGLGLSISKELTHLLKGKLSLESEIDVGSSFSVIIPNTYAKMALSEETLDSKSSARDTKFTVTDTYQWLLDDRNTIEENDTIVLFLSNDRFMCESTQKYIKDTQYKFITSNNGREGIQLAEQFMPSVILLDQKLSDIPFQQVLSQLKSLMQTRFIPIHVFSEGSDAELLALGAQGGLKKPFRASILSQLIPQESVQARDELKAILVIEDDKNSQVAVQSLISDDKIKLTFASSSSEAIAILNKNIFDCIILDLNLPDLKGIALVEKISKQDNVGETPIIIYTGQSISEQEQRALHQYSPSIVLKGTESAERLSDEVALFLHQVEKQHTTCKPSSLQMLHDENEMLVDRHVLVVDDDMRNVFAITRILEGAGMIVAQAENGQVALDIIDNSTQSFDLILMDIMMPVLDGFETIRIIRQKSQYQDTPIIALTAKSMPEDEHKCIEVGASEYLTKPLDLNRLLSMIRVWLYRLSNKRYLENE
ncbi:MAG: response regulator [Colwellia sp.]|nr:response regulator [Colwellia sp.]